MTTVSGGEWRFATLGPNWERIQHNAALAISEAHVDAARAQFAQSSKAKDPYGHTLKVSQHESLNERLMNVPGIVLRRPKNVRSRFAFPIVESTNTVIVPWRFSTDPHIRHAQVTKIERLSELRRALLSTPTPPAEPDLFEAAADENFSENYEGELAAYEELTTAGRAVVVAYGSTPDGIFELGIAELILDSGTGAMLWRHWVALSTYGDLSAGPTAPQLRPVKDESTIDRFDSDDVPDDLGLRLRLVENPVPESEARPEDDYADESGEPVQ